MRWMLIGVIVLSVGVNAFLFYRTVSYKKDAAVKEQIIADIGVNSHMLSWHESNFMWNLKSERCDLSGLRIIDTLGNDVGLHDIAGKPVLAYRFREMDCQDCINFGLRKVESFAVDTAVKVVVIAQYNDNFQFKRWWRTTSKKRIKGLNIQEDLPQDKMSMPYFFVLHPDLTMGELFIPDKSNPEYTSRYLKVVKEKYFN